MPRRSEKALFRWSRIQLRLAIRRARRIATNIHEYRSRPPVRRRLSRAC